MRMDLNLESPFLPCRHQCAMPEAKRFQLSAERDHVLCKRPAEIRGVAAGMEPAEATIQFALRFTNPRRIPNHQRSIDGRHCAPAPRLRLNPPQYLVHALQAIDASQPQVRPIKDNRRQTARLSIPTQIHAKERSHNRGMNSTASPTETRPGVTT